MADTSFRFGTDVSSDDNLLSPDEGDCLEIEEEEYDALNDETFGTLDQSGLDDWEQQHEQFAELTESSRHSERLENSLNKLSIEDSSSYLFPTSKNSVWSYNAPQNGEIFSSSLLSNIQKVSKTFVDSTNNSRGVLQIEDTLTFFSTSTTPLPSYDRPPSIGNQIPKKFCTVEELERGLLQNRAKTHSSQSAPSPAPTPSAPPAPLHHLPQSQLPHHYGQHPVPAPRLPPGLSPIGVPHPHMRHLHHVHPNMPPGLVRLMPPAHHYMQGTHTPPPGLMYPPPPHQFPVNHPFNFPPPPRIGNMHNMPHQNSRLNHHNHQHHRNKMDVNNGRQRNEYYEHKDEYSALMSNREKQWLMNIQLVQLNTGTPYFDDYYYTIFKERKVKNSKENQPPLERIQWHNNRRNSDRQENQNPLTPKVYTPLQFENSLGKLQCGSVTAPRKIIDMDIVTPDKDSEMNSNSSRDTKKTKQLLLELEAFYSLILKAEDLRNPLFKSNMEKLCDIKQKQRLRELDVASTTEQKQEILKALKQESEPLTENPQDYLVKVISGLFQEEKYVSFLSIRKGKMLLLRILPYLTGDSFATQLPDLWIKVLLSIPMVGRKDAAGDHLFLRLHPYFKRFIQVSDMNVILDIVSNLLEVLSPDNSRGTPISCQGKPPLYFIVANKFGVSALAMIFVRTEYLISSGNASEKQQTDWFNFVVCWAESLLVPKLVLVTPLEPVPSLIFNKHCDRIGNLTVDRKTLLERWISDGS